MDRLAFFTSLLEPGKEHWGSRNIPVEDTVSVSSGDAAAMLSAYEAGDVSYEQLLDWANLLLFNDAFSLENDAVCECLDRIEESDEPGNELAEGEVAKIIEGLRSEI